MLIKAPEEAGRNKFRTAALNACGREASNPAPRSPLQAGTCEGWSGQSQVELVGRIPGWHFSSKASQLFCTEVVFKTNKQKNYTSSGTVH